MAGLPIVGIGTMFYVVLMLGIGATKLWRWGLACIRRIGKRQRQALGSTSPSLATTYSNNKMTRTRGHRKFGEMRT